MPCPKRLCAPERAVRAWEEHQLLYLNYPDMPGRQAHYMIRGRIPDDMRAGLWGPGYTIPAILDIFVQAMDLPAHVPDNWRAFLATNLTSKCMVITKARTGGGLTALRC